MQLAETFIEAAVMKMGADTYQMDAGAQFQIRTKNAGEEIIEEFLYQVPAGKRAVVKLTMLITETDA